MQLNDGNELPSVGLGTYPLKDEAAVQAVAAAIDLGYRHVDTAVNYRNEEAVGRGVLVPTNSTVAPTRSGGRPAAVYRFRDRNLLVTNEFAAFRPGPA